MHAEDGRGLLSAEGMADLILGICALHFHKQRYHQTADLEAEAVTKIREPHHTCAGPSLHLSLARMRSKREN